MDRHIKKINVKFFIVQFHKKLTRRSSPNTLRHKKQSSFKLLVFYLFAFLISVTSAPGIADINSGLAWLSQQANPEGDYTGSQEIATPYQATSETLRTFNEFTIADPNISVAREFVNADPVQNTEFLARRIISIVEAEQDPQLIIEQLLLHQSLDGSFGDFPGYGATAMDTSYALEAFAAADLPISPEIALAVGFLLNQQNADGGWSASEHAAEGSSVFITALTLKALSHYRQVYNLEQVIAEGKDYLLAKKNTDALWGEPFLSSLTIMALIHITNDQGTIADSISALQALQQSDGSWDQDVYTTALALRASHVSETPPINPILASIKGRLIDGITGLPLANATVSLNGPSPGTITTSNTGIFHFIDLIAGNYTLQSELTGYPQVTAETMTLAGQTVDFGDIRLLPEIDDTTNTITTATITGAITDSETGLPLEGVSVALSGSDSDHALTDVDGAYQFTNVATGAITLITSKSGYSTASGNTSLTAGGVFFFSPKLTPADIAITAVKGTVLEASTGLPLKDVLIAVTGSTMAQAHTDALGNYQITGILPGNISIEASLDNYDTVIAHTEIHENNIISFSPELHPINTSPVGSNLSGLEGIVVDAATNEPLSNVLITLINGSETQEYTTSADGAFIFDGLNTALVMLNFSKNGYVTPEFNIPLVPLETLNIGQVRLREENTVELLPDLTVDAVDLTQTTTQLNTLKILGTVSASIRNQGTAKAAVTDLIAFYDANNDEVYNSDVDTLLGQSSTAGELAIEDIQDVLVDVQGILPYRDAPVSVWVDSQQSLIESNEQNNVYSSASACTIEPLPAGALDPVEKWHWSGSSIASSYKQVMSTPMVAQLTDDNGDGKIDTGDTPDVIFTTFSGGGYTRLGILRAISGADGTDIWNIAPQSTAYTSPAVGDIDNDGVVEIVVGGPHLNGLRVYEHDGTLKWQVSFSGFAHPAIADLDNDGIPEIIHGHRVFNSQGTLLKVLSRGDNLSIAVDLDLDGDLEIIANGIAYQHDGSTIWNSGYRGVYSAVGNFDDDDFPEIAIRTSGSVTLLQHDGSLIWGPVAIPGGGGGPLTISDVDGDGEPEIGVAGSRNYAVIETDGSIKWTSPTRDFSSSVTGSSVFDFENDGKAEILYNDELYFRIYDGETGTILFQTQNTSGTLWEFPVVADVDNDGHAEIVLASNNYAFGGKTGIRVFENRDDLWAATRSILNQHTYHINNVNDDGSIPQYEEPSWLSHNTYRLNTFVDRDPLSTSDLTISLLRYIEQDTGASQDLTARIGNAGSAPLSSVTDVAFYEGDPDNGGQLLGITTILSLAVNEFQDITLADVTLSGTNEIYVVVDPDDRVSECNEINNSMQIPVPEATLGQITAATDQPVYGPNQSVLLQASVANNSTFTGNFTGQLQIEDAMGTLIDLFPEQPMNLLGGGTSIDFSHTWNTSDYLVGVYVLRGRLYGTDGLLQDQSTAFFNISHSTDQNDLAVTLRTTTDNPIYHTKAVVQIGDLVENITVNSLVDEALLHIKVLDPPGLTLMDENIMLGQLLPGSLRDLITPLALNNAATGGYNILGVVLDAQTNEILASSHAQFEVVADLYKDLTGVVSAKSKTVERGEIQECTDTVIYAGSRILTAQSFRSLLVNMDRAELVTSNDFTITLEPGATDNRVRSIPTSGLVEGHYRCVLQTQIGGEWTTLADDNFTVTAPPINIAGTLEQVDAPRLLVLLDGIKHCGGDDDGDDWDDDKDKDKDKDKDNDCSVATPDTDPHGPSGAPLLSDQRSYLAAVLTAQGWSYTIVTDADDFTQKLRSGTYNTYALFSEQSKLAEQTQKELREAIFGGEGLLIAGDHDHRHNKLDAVLGVEVKGKLQAPTGIRVETVEQFLAGGADFSLSEKVRRIEVRDAKVVADYPGLSDCLGNDDDDDDDQEEEDDNHPDCDSVATAVTRNQYGYGHSVYTGFDLLAQAALSDADPLFTELLIDALGAIKADTTPARTGSVISLRLKLMNQGIATPGQVVITLSDGSQIIDPGLATAQVDGSLLWVFDLAEGASDELTFWQQMSDTAGPALIEALIQVGTVPDLVDYDTLLITLNLSQGPDLPKVLEELVTLTSQHEDYQKAHNKVEKALNYWNEGKYEKALEDALKAADDLAGLDHVDAKTVRRQLALAIRSIERLLPEPDVALSTDENP